MSELAVEEHKGHLVVRVRVVPRAAHTHVVGVEEGVLVVRVAAPPVDGKANAALVELLRESLRLRKNQIHLESGEKSRHKRIALEGTSVEHLLKLARGEET